VKRARVIHRGHATRFTVDVTEHAIERMRGLLGHAPLDPEHGLWLEPCNAVHTFGMRFPVDVVFIDRRGIVRAIHRNVTAGRMLFCFRARAALELRAHAVDSWGLETGDAIAWKVSR
jgi:uncharacterized protein